MPRRPANLKAKKSTPNSKQEEAQQSLAMDESIDSEVVDLSSSPVKDSKGSIETKEDDEFPNTVLEEQGMVIECEDGIIEKENEGLEVNDIEDDGLLMSKVLEVMAKKEEVGFQEEKIGGNGIDDYLTLTSDGRAVVLEDSSNLNGEVNDKDKNLDVAVVENDSNLNSRLAVEEEEEEENVSLEMGEDDSNLNCEDGLVKGRVAGMDRELEAVENAGSGDQNRNDTHGINQGIRDIERFWNPTSSGDILPDDPEKDEKIKGFAFLEFSSHTNVMVVFQRLRKPDAIFGCARSAKVAFTPSEEVLSQLRTVYVEGLPESWDEAKMTEICKQMVRLKELDCVGILRKNARILDSLHSLLEKGL